MKKDQNCRLWTNAAGINPDCLLTGYHEIPGECLTCTRRMSKTLTQLVQEKIAAGVEPSPKGTASHLLTLSPSYLPYSPVVKELT